MCEVGVRIASAWQRPDLHSPAQELHLVAGSAQQDPPIAASPPPAPSDGQAVFSTAKRFWSNYKDAISAATRDNATATDDTATPTPVYHGGAVSRLPPAPEEASAPEPPPPAPRRAADPPPPVRPRLSKDAAQWVEMHNKVRAAHHAPALVWDASLADGAQAWANQCVFQHSSPDGAYGENLYASTGVQDPVADSVKQWAAEESSYDFAAGGFSEATGHFTQVVWKATKHLGCGIASGCGASNDGMDTLVVCRYTPAGNVIGSFTTNVLPP